MPGVPNGIRVRCHWRGNDRAARRSCMEVCAHLGHQRLAAHPPTSRRNPGLENPVTILQPPRKEPLPLPRCEFIIVSATGHFVDERAFHWIQPRRDHDDRSRRHSRPPAILLNVWRDPRCMRPNQECHPDHRPAPVPARLVQLALGARDGTAFAATPIVITAAGQVVPALRTPPTSARSIPKQRERQHKQTNDRQQPGQSVKHPIAHHCLPAQCVSSSFYHNDARNRRSLPKLPDSPDPPSHAILPRAVCTFELQRHLARCTRRHRRRLAACPSSLRRSVASSLLPTFTQPGPIRPIESGHGHRIHPGRTRAHHR